MTRAGLLLLFLLAPAAAGAAPHPDVQPGDYWEWTTHYDASPDYDVVERVEVVGRGAFGAEENAIHQQARIETRTLGRPDVIKEEREDWRTAQGALIESRVWVNESRIFRLTITTYSPPCEEVRYPLSPTTQWSRKCDATVASFRNNETQPASVKSIQENWKVARIVATDTPAGKFDTYLLEATRNKGWHLNWYSPLACGFVKDVASTPDSPIRLLTKYQCAAGIVDEAIVPQPPPPAAEKSVATPALLAPVALALVALAKRARR